MTTNWDVALLYIAALVPALIAAFALAPVATWLVWPSPVWLVAVFAISLSAGGSYIIYWLVNRRMLRHIARESRGGVAGHIVRSASMYVCLIASVLLVPAKWTDPDFGLFWQIFLWSGTAGLGGVVADAAACLRMGRG